MDTLTDAVINALRMIQGWDGNTESITGLLEEIREELERGLGAVATPPEITPEQQGDIDDTLGALGLPKREEK